MRPEIELFAKMMEAELTANEKKGDWKKFTNERDIIYEIEYHKAKLLFALKFDNQEEIQEYAADVANNLLCLLNSRGLLCTLQQSSRESLPG
jgi:hypothetical protein